jgi:hypothetical protein
VTGSAPPSSRCVAVCPAPGENREHAAAPTWSSTSVLTGRGSGMRLPCARTHPSRSPLRGPAGRSLVDRGREIRDRPCGPPLTGSDPDGSYEIGVLGAHRAASACGLRRGLLADGSTRRTRLVSRPRGPLVWGTTAQAPVDALHQKRSNRFGAATAIGTRGSPCSVGLSASTSCPGPHVLDRRGVALVADLVRSVGQSRGSA